MEQRIQKPDTFHQVPLQDHSLHTSSQDPKQKVKNLDADQQNLANEGQKVNEYPLEITVSVKRIHLRDHKAKDTNLQEPKSPKIPNPKFPYSEHESLFA